jgi:hypothetical protein
LDLLSVGVEGLDSSTDSGEKEVEFDEAWYLKTYPDVAKAIQEGVVKSALGHYLNHGRSEGRRPKAASQQRPREKQYFIHVGPHKTGTTSLQAAFKDAQGFLLKNGVLYPDNWLRSDGSYGHHLLFSHLRGGEDTKLREDFSSFQDVDVEKILISAEDLSDLNEREIDRLKALTQGSSVTIIAYIRRWSERLVSAWKESVHHGSTLTFPHFVAAELAAPTRSNQVNMMALVRRYSAAFGRDNIRLISYDHIIEKKIDIVEHYFRSILGLECDAPVKSSRVNLSLDWSDAELERALNSINDRLGGAYRARIGTVDTSRIRDAMERYQGSIVLDETDRLWGMFQNDFFETFGDLLIEPKPRRGFYEPKINTIRYVTPGYLLEPGIADEFAKLRDILQGKSRQSGRL